MESKLEVQLPGVDFSGLARQAIAAKLTQAMIGADDAIARIVADALTAKVSDRGVVSSSSYENKTPFAEWMAQDLIRAATRSVMATKIESMRPAIEKAVEAALRRSIAPMAQGLVETFISNAKSGYAIDVALSFKPRSQY